MASSVPSARRRLALGGALVLALGAGGFLLLRTPARPVVPAAAPARTVAATPARIAPALPVDAAGRRARLEKLRFLETNDDGKVAVLDDELDKRSYFVRAQTEVLEAKVILVSPDRVMLEDAIAGRIELPHRGRALSPPPATPAFEVRGSAVPVHLAPSVDPVQVAADQAAVDAYIASRPKGIGGGRASKGAGGGGQGGGRDPDQQGGPGRQNRLREQAAAERAAGSAAVPVDAPR